ncbi:hypothetical protein [Sorangium sp. So ce426]|uniref:hypothetical protein n=1 Tax=Sorangium sp. So ce426 TaxID=3133312 RepID=UPI003F5B0947
MALPNHVVERDSEAPVLPFRWVHPAVDQLRELAGTLIEHARQHANDEAVAVGHILMAVSQAIERNDLSALNAEGGPHTWARRYIRPDDNFIGGGYIPIEDRNGRLLKGGVQSITGGFRHLTKTLTFAITYCREHGSCLDTFTQIVALSMGHNFPSLVSLSGEPDMLKRCQTIEGRIKNQLKKLGEKWAVEIPESAAQEIARALLEVEFKLSGKDNEALRKAFTFLDTH